MYKTRPFCLIIACTVVLGIGAAAASASTVTVTPGIVDMSGGGQQTFQVSGTGSSAGVGWSVTPALGSISPSGVYTAPAVTADATATIVATSNADPSQTASATVSLHVTPLKFTTQATGLKTLVFNGVNYNYIYGEGLLSYVTTMKPGGQAVFTTPSCNAGASTDTTVTKSCTSGAVPMAIKVTYATPDPATITAAVQITNNSPTDSVTDATFSTLGITISQLDAARSRILKVDDTNPISYVNFYQGQYAIWNNRPSPDVTVTVGCGYSYICKTQPHLLNIAPGQTKTATFSLRFSSNSSVASIDLAPEAYAAFPAAYPPVVNWPDRRPIMAWFISDYTKRSATNPRGYLQDPTVDISNTAAFQNRVLGQAQSIITQIKARPVQPQGIVIWDLEGQEFIQPTTYVGDPRVLSNGYAQEMNGVADQLFALFKSAGLKVGLTLRPQYVNWGTTLPAACRYDVQNDYKDYFIKTDNTFGQRFFACYDPAGAAWSLIPQGNGGQTFYTPAQASNVTALLMSKVAYAHARWGTTLYYVDSSVWHGGAALPQDIFRTLQLAFPDCLFIPEQSYAATMGVGMPYADPKNSSAPKFAPLSWRYIYPNGGLGIYLSNCVGTCWTTNSDFFKIGQKVGDIAMYTQPTQMSSAQLSSIEGMIQQARSEASLVTVTDSATGSSYSYKGFPDTFYNYPVKMRVYFAPSPAAVSSSTTFCESVGLSGTNSCSLNLSGLTTAQIRYYDFNGMLISSNAPQAR
ncbi:MAG: Ig domain protein group 2 domain protein [Bryobacterales bacterium]|nr:Ig domain protein group 2 domain protein [Bryobacterales bacterium]